MGFILLTGFVILVLGLMFMPWQQFISGTGRVIAYDPLERSVPRGAPA